MPLLSPVDEVPESLMQIIEENLTQDLKKAHSKSEDKFSSEYIDDGHGSQSGYDPPADSLDNRSRVRFCGFELFSHFNSP